MAQDAKGNDITTVGVPIDGFLSFAPESTELLTPVEGAAKPLVLPATFKKAGLITEDGGFNFESETEDNIEFFQQGYSIPGGSGSVTLTVKFAQYDETLRSLVYGQEADENGYLVVSAGGSGKRVVIFAEEVFKNGVIRRRQAIATVQSAQLDQSTRGEINGTEVVFNLEPVAELGYGHYGEWLVALD